MDLKSSTGLPIQGSTTAPITGQGPTAQFFPTEGTMPGVNTDVKVTVSVNAKLIRVERGIGDHGHGEERYGLNWEEFDNLVGRLLTLCDATFTDPVQRKAFKDQVRDHVRSWVRDCASDAAYDAGIILSPDPASFGVEGLWGVEQPDGSVKTD